MKLIEFPQQSAALSIPNALRNLADSIEAGKFEDAHNLAWSIDCGNGRIAVGLLGACAEPATTAHFLLALGMRNLENGALSE